jgi:hypothetical protein
MTTYIIAARKLSNGEVRFMPEENYPKIPTTLKEAIEYAIQYAVDVTDETHEGWAYHVEERE